MSKIWKRIGLIILIIACLFNITIKLINKVSFNDTINAAKVQFENMKNNFKK